MVDTKTKIFPPWARLLVIALTLLLGIAIVEIFRVLRQVQSQTAQIAQILPAVQALASLSQKSISSTVAPVNMPENVVPFVPLVTNAPREKESSPSPVTAIPTAAEAAQPAALVSGGDSGSAIAERLEAINKVMAENGPEAQRMQGIIENLPADQRALIEQALRDPQSLIKSLPSSGTPSGDNPPTSSAQ